jgi:truncated hemoglobin YjbI
MKPFDKIGEAKLRAVLTDFYDRVFRDVMIGFMFQGKDKQHLIEREYEMTAKMLGANVEYRGQPLRTAHARHTIFGGHFERRTQIMREAMADHDVDPEVRQIWLDHTNALRAQITRDQGSECKDTAETKPKLAIAVPEQPDKPIKLGRKG